MLDESHPRLQQPPSDSNSYKLGNIQGHNVVIAGLPTPGNNSTATVVAHMKTTFPRLRFCLLVGIGCGVPTRTDAGPIKLGHVVVSNPNGQHSGAIQYDHGKAEAGEFRRTGFLAPPPNVLLNAAHQLAVTCARAREDPLQMHLRRIDTSIRGLRRYKHPGPDKDHLYQASYVHADRLLSCQKCGCDAGKRVDRGAEDDEDEDEEDDIRDDNQWVTVHRGTIASGELVMRNGDLRDKLAKQHDVLCFEMEAAGALNDFPCLVIRGISDYSDSHKNDRWHGYAAATAAAYARELSSHMPIDEVAQCKIAESDIKQVIEDTRYVARSNKIAEIRDWLNPPDPSINYNQARELYSAGTGSWFLESEGYVWWKTKSSRALWLHGIPGCLKTILSSTVIQDLQRSLTHPTVLYFFFDFNESSKQTFDKMLRSLIFQLQNEDSWKHTEHLVSSCKDRKEQPQTEALVTTLQMAIEAISDVWIILDALEECKTRKELLSWLESCADRRWHLLITSREEHDIKSSLMKWLAVKDVVPIQAKPVDDDIRAFVRHKIENDEDFARWSKSDARAMIESKLMAKAGGMFRLVVCQIDSLRDCLDLLTLEQTLDSLPKTLEKVYDQILLNIPLKFRPSAIRILQFLSYSERPLRLEEAVDAIAVRLDTTPTFCAQYRMPDPSELARYCASLTRIVKRAGDQEEPAIVAELQLAHLSVQEYLLSGQVDEIFRDDFQESRAKGCIVQVSIAYLFRASQERHEGQNWQFPLTQFAAEYWMGFAPSAEKEGKVVLDWIHQLFTFEDLYECWLKIFDPDDPHGWLRGAKNPSALYYASLGGLTNSARDLLDNADVNAKGGRYRKALQAASYGGHVGTVKLLLDKGADVNADGGYYGNALQAASHGSYYGNVLQAASDGGHVEILKLLLDKGADVNAEGGKYGNALQAASLGGHVETVKPLLDKGADVKADGGVYGYALQAASANGHSEIVKLLLREGSDGNAS